MAGNEIVKTITVREDGVEKTARSFDRLAVVAGNASAAADKVAASVQNGARGFDRTAKSVGSTEVQLNRLQRTLDPTYRDTERLSKAEDVLSRSLAKGVIDIQRHNELLDFAKGRYGFAAQAAEHLAASQATIGRATVAMNDNVRLAGHEMTNLSRQGQDVVTMFAMGASPMQIFSSQAAQIYDAIGSGEGGLAGGFARLKGSAAAGLASLAGFATTLPGIAIGLTAAAGAALYFATRTTDKIKPLNEAMEAHRKAIGDVAAAYGLAERKAEDFSRTSAGVAAVLARQSAAELKLSARQTLNDAFAPSLTNYKILTPAVGTDGAFGKVGVAAEYEAFSKPLLKLNAEMEKGTGNAINFVEAVAEIANQRPADAALQKHASELIGLAKAAAEAQRMLSGATPAQRTNAAAERRRLDAILMEIER